MASTTRSPDDDGGDDVGGDDDGDGEADSEDGEEKDDDGCSTPSKKPDAASDHLTLKRPESPI